MIKYLLVAACLLATTADARVITKSEPVAPTNVTEAFVATPQIQIPVMQNEEEDTVELTLQWNGNIVDPFGMPPGEMTFFLYPPSSFKQLFTLCTDDNGSSMGSNKFSFTGPLDGTYYWYGQASGTNDITLGMCTPEDKLVIWQGTQQLPLSLPTDDPPGNGWLEFTWPPSN